MKTEQQIKQLETELQELLQRVMKTPLSPITDTIKGIQNHLEEVETLVQEIRNEDLIGLSLSAQDAEKQIRLIKSSIENTPQEVKKTVHPLLQQEIKLFEQAQHTKISQLQIKLTTSAEENSLHLQDALGEKIKQQSTHNEQSLAQLLAHSKRTEQQSISALEQTSQDLTAKIAAVSTSVAGLQEAQAAQAHQSSSALENTAQTLIAQISAQATSISKLQAVLGEQAKNGLQKSAR